MEFRELKGLKQPLSSAIHNMAWLDSLSQEFINLGGYGWNRTDQLALGWEIHQG